MIINASVCITVKQSAVLACYLYIIMDKQIKNKIIVITGGAEGIGFQIAKYFLKEQAKLAILVDINEERGCKAVESLTSEFGDNKAVFIKCDVTKDLEETFRIIQEKYKNIDVLVNNAGIAESLDMIKKCVEINLTATIQWSLKFLEHIQPGGTIINISSIFGYRISYQCPVYNATKFGVIGFTKSLGHEKNFAKHGVRVIAVCPGFTGGTNLSKHIKGSDMLVELQKDYIWQEREAVGVNTIEIFKKAESGSVWEIEGGVLQEVKL